MDFEIYFSDLTEEAQRSLLDAFGITDAKEANWDAFPVIALPIAGCSMFSSVSIPSTVTTIGSSAFASCNSLTDVYYDGLPESWNSIYPTWGIDIPDTIIHYSADIIPNPDFILPAALATIEDEAFVGGAFIYVVPAQQIKYVR